MNFDKYPILATIDSPEDVKLLEPEGADVLAKEIREFLCESVQNTGGHLASNLGVVELSIALHRVFKCPTDSIVWDVGHQSYVHKLLTGRKERFDTLRQAGGLCGFTKRSESLYDAFGAGHSSTSVSAALGIAESEKLKGSDAWTVAVVGDGAFTGGMIHEALNNCRMCDDLRLIIVINENEMSISKNIGSFATAISKMRTSPHYFRTKTRTKNFLSRVPLIGKPITKGIVRLKKFLKNTLYGTNYFEDLGFYYIGPADGNDRQKVEDMLIEAKRCGDPAIVHIKTVKGKGYAPAEENPGAYHSVSPHGAPKKGGFSEAFGESLCEIAKDDPKVCAITASMMNGTGLCGFAEKYPDRFFDVGIAEEHATTFASGLAAGGYKPVFAVYSSFLQRSYDNIVHDVALQSLPVVFGVDRAGLNSSDGATHHGIFDVSFLSSVPGMRIYTPATYTAQRRALYDAISSGCPAAIRYSGENEDEEIKAAFYQNDTEEKPVQRSFGIKADTSCVIVCHGRMAKSALLAAQMLNNEEIRTGVVLCEYIKPYEKAAEEILGLIPATCEKIVFVEEEIRSGGFGVNMRDAFFKLLPDLEIKIGCVAVDDSFPVPKTGQSVFEAAGVDSESIVGYIKNM